MREWMFHVSLPTTFAYICFISKLSLYTALNIPMAICRPVEDVHNMYIHIVR